MQHIVEARKSVGIGIFVIVVSALVWCGSAQAQIENIDEYNQQLNEHVQQLNEAASRAARMEDERVKRLKAQSQQPENASTSEGADGGGGSSSNDAAVIGGAIAVVAAVVYFGYRHFNKKKSKEQAKLVTPTMPISDRAELVLMHPLLNGDPKGSSIQGIDSWEQLAAGSLGMKIAF